MLRVGLTGGLGSGKSTVAALLRAKGAHVIEADELGRTMMEPGHPVFSAVIAHFGPSILAPDGTLDRKLLASIVFDKNTGTQKLAELNAIVHPAVIQAQTDWVTALQANQPNAIAIVESALIFEVERDARLRGETDGLLADWRTRFDKLIVVTAPEALRIDRFLARTLPSGLAAADLTQARERITADAHSRIARQIPENEKIARADFVITNSGDVTQLAQAIDALWPKLTSINT